MRFGELLALLGQGQLQHAVVVLRLYLVGLDARYIEAAAVGAVGTLAADVLIFLILFLMLRVTLGVDGEPIAVDVELDILLVESGQVGSSR